jgi:hypothetical protein
MAKKATVKVEENVNPMRGRKEWVVNHSDEMKKIMEERKKAEAIKKEKESKYKKAECPKLDPKKFYDFEFNNEVPKQFSKEKKRRITGELAMHFIRSNYGSLSEIKD